jgi:hypothetical protein
VSGTVFVSLRQPLLYSSVLVMADDFGPAEGMPTTAIPSVDGKKKGAQGEKRTWLKVFETLGPQLLNAYGEAGYGKQDDATMWKAMSTPLKSGAVYISELCSKDEERRGIGLNRWIHPISMFCKYQQSAKVREQNAYLLKESMLKELYSEIDDVLPSLEYCLAPRKTTAKQGAASLRSSAYAADAPVSTKTPELLDKHAKRLYELLDTSKVSRIRMLATWQSAAGMSFIAGVHHRGAQCFRYHGNSLHGEGKATVSLEEFQQAIKVRHSIGDGGMGASESTASADFGG